MTIHALAPDQTKRQQSVLPGKNILRARINHNTAKHYGAVVCFWGAYSMLAVLLFHCFTAHMIAQPSSAKPSSVKSSKSASTQSSPQQAPKHLPLVSSISLDAPALQYPATRKVDHVDDYHGVKIADPYRWLEDDTSKETEAWVGEQNALTFGYLSKIPFRKTLLERIEQLYNYPKYSAPLREGPYTFFSKNDGLQNQSVLYIQERGKDVEVFFDPNKLSTDGTVRLAQTALSNYRPGKPLYWAYGLSKGGSDWSELYVMDVATRKTSADRIQWVKVSGVAWQGDGFYYSRYPAPSNEKSLASKNENHQVWYHKVGTDQSQDKLVYQDPANPQRFHLASVTDDERFLVLSISDRGKGKDGNALYVMDMQQKHSASGTNGGYSFKPIITNFDDDFSVIDNVGDKLLVLTNYKAPNKRVVLIDPNNPVEAQWKIILPEKPEPLNYATTAGGKLIANYSKDVTHRVYVYSLDGVFENEVQLPTLGTVSGFGGKKDDETVFYTVTSFTFPSTTYEYNVKTKQSTLFRASEVKFTPEEFETKQVFYPSKDGTKIPMFIVHKKGIKLDGNNPTLLYGYGGFNISLFPSFSPTLIAWLEQGGVYALANLRGGGEYGERWHEQGMKLNKQNVFDDFIAAAEYLIRERYTSPERLAIKGGSNGGLLVGACANQRPDLFKVALPAVGVMDMLRFQKFTIGWNWVADYGSSDNPEEFAALLKYSPLHNIKQGVNYPATLITTADHDDRVVPAHSFKYAATLQEKQSRAPNAHPVLIRIDTKSGHGASNTKKALEVAADEYAFAWWNMKFVPTFQAR
jgi:prolyl oligopeptidase